MDDKRSPGAPPMPPSSMCPNTRTARSCAARWRKAASLPSTPPLQDAHQVKIQQAYVIPRENHNPIEMHATIAAWDGDRLTLWDKTQWVHNVADEIGAVFGIPAENVRVVSPFVGGAFGSGLRAWPHVTL